MSSIREEVLARIVAVVRVAHESGLDGVAVARATFPGTPDAVLWEAWATVDSQLIEGWWQSVEKTIDAEIIKLAISKAAGVQ